ncbi:MAG: heme exporter protein CcmB [Geminicoccaceae bacterium]|nr:MAG: heme exporter protein CcmB [Geminicoccaceae bacterium]
MRAALALLGHELRLAFRAGGEMAQGLIFFLLALSLFPLGVGPGPVILERIGVGLIWVLALFSVTLTLERLYAADARDGTLDLLGVSGLAFEWVALIKALAHWLTSGLVLVAFSPLVVLLLGLPSEAFLAVPVVLLIGTPTLTLIGGIGAALLVHSRRGGLLLALIVLPLQIPVLIFGVSAIEGWVSGLGASGQLMILGAFLLGTAALAPFATAAALRLALE